MLSTAPAARYVGRALLLPLPDTSLTLPPMATAPLLTYACITDPFPLQASPLNGTAVATLQVVATNKTGAPVTLQGVSIQLPVGSAADALTLDPSSIRVVPPTTWKQQQAQSPAGAIVYTLLPDGGPVALAVGDSLAFALNSVEVNHAAGTATVTVTEGSGGCAPADCPTEALPVTKFPAGWGIVEFSAVDADVNPGEDASVQWAGPPGATYTLRYYTPATGVVSVPAAGAAPLGPMGTYPGTTDPPLPLQQTTVFTLDVAYTPGGETYSAQRQATVVVVPPAPTITRFDGQLSGPLDALVLTLTWETENATTCELTGTSEQLDAQGTWSFPNPVDTGPIVSAYTLTANGAQGLTPATAVFNTPPRVTKFTGTPVVNGTSMQLQLSWDTWLGGSCTITGVPGVLAANGSATVTPTAQAPLLSDYTLTATARGKTDTSTLSLQWAAQPVATTEYPGMATGIAATLDGLLVVATQFFEEGGVPGQQEVLHFSGATLRPTAQHFMPVAGGPGSIAINPAGTRVFIASGTTLGVFDAQTFEPVPGSPVALPVQGAGGAVSAQSGVAVSAGGDRVFVCSGSYAPVVVVNAQTLAITGQFKLEAPPATGVAVTADGLQIVFAALNGLYTVDARTYAYSARPIYLLGDDAKLTVALTPDSVLAVAATGAEFMELEMCVVDLRTQATRQSIKMPPGGNPFESGSIAPAISPDGTLLYAATIMNPSSIGDPDPDEPKLFQLAVFLRTVVSGGIGG